MKIILCCFLLTLALCGMSQLKPIESGVIYWDSLPVKKDAQRESRKIATATTNEFEYFEIHATTQPKGAAAKPDTRKKI